jgi:hypothetical protein
MKLTPEIENMNIPRYKIIVQTTIGQLKDQGIRIASRCLWDVSTDNYTSVSYTNVSLWIYHNSEGLMISLANHFLQRNDFCSIH